ncbi:MAG: hypothetical protein JXR73_08075 [Candidatus Omnitrophica bacterium]|nr:hypothetical protein [Candidatus Omnitrophota bacterium]
MKTLANPLTRRGLGRNGCERFWTVFAAWILILATGVGLCLADAAPDLVFVQIPAQSEPSLRPEGVIYLPSDRYVDGMRIVRLSADSKGEAMPLTPEFASACDPAVSFDGNHILFAGKKSEEDYWQIWRMNRDGGGKKRIISRDGDCLSPLYVGCLFHLNDEGPSDQLAYISSEAGGANEYGVGPCYSLYAAVQDGSFSTRITFNLSSDFDPDVLPNGRIVFTSWRRSAMENWPLGCFGLMAVSNDGTDMLPYYGNLSAPPFKGMARVAPQAGRMYFVESEQSNWLGGGDLAYVTLRRPLKTHAVLSSEEAGLFANPCPLPDGGLIASYRRIDKQGGCYELYRIDPDSGDRREIVYAEEGLHCVDAQVLAPHPRVKGRSSVVDLEKETGVFFCLDVYNSDLPEVKNLARGTVKSLRVIEGLPVMRNLPRVLLGSPPFEFAGAGANHYTATPFAAKRIVGLAPVEEDGSFHIEVPAQIPIAFQLLDERGMALAEQRSWTWVVPKEKRGCIGCHEDRELSPPNRLVNAVVQNARRLTLPPSRRRMVDFVHEVKPILEAKCSGMGCHSPGQAQPELDFERLVEHPDEGALFPAAYESLLSPIPGRPKERYVKPGGAKDSPLIWQILGERTGDSDYSGVISVMPPSAPLTGVEKMLLIEWIDLGAMYNIRDIANAVDLRDGASGEK